MITKKEKQRNCRHEYKICYSTFGSDQGVFCVLCWKPGSNSVYRDLKIKELEEEIEKIKQLYPYEEQTSF